MQLFLSYSRIDKAFVDKLADDLERRGHGVWIDTDDLPREVDDRWRRGIVKGIRESTALVLVLSPDSVASEQVERELTVAAEIKRRVIPIVCRPTELPDGFQFELAGVQRTDFTVLGYDEGLEELNRRLGAAEPSVTTPPVDSPGPQLPPLPPPASAAAPDPGGRKRPTRLVVVGAACALALLAVGIAVLLATRDGDAAGGVPTTTATTASTASTATTASTASTDNLSPTTTATEPTTPTAPTTSLAPTTGEQAVRVVQNLAVAYTDRDWDAVRAINPGQAGLSDAQFERAYGSSTSLPRLVTDHHHVLVTAQQTPTTWVLTGAIIAWDLLEGEQQSTNVACVRWTADVPAGTASPKGVRGSDGKENRRLSGWVAEAEFDATARQYCG